eukprot:scaffold61103_cov38-Attheya_sp.AAC.1
MAAATVVFRALLVRIGLHNDTTSAVVDDQGVDTMEELENLEESDIKDLAIGIIKSKVTGPGAPDIAFPFRTQKRLMIARFWIDLRRLSDESIVPSEFTNAELALATTWKKEVYDKKAANKYRDPSKPPKLSTFKNWRPWWEHWDNYMSQLFGSANLALRYIYREHKTVTPAMLAETHPSYHERFTAITAFKNSHYVEDNEMVGQELKPLVIDGPGWTFVQSFEKARNGRGAILALRAQNEGENSMLIRKQTAYLALSTLQFSGPRKTWSFQNYIEGHQKAHNELHDCKEPVSDTKKVSDFLQGITDPTLANGITNVYGDTAKMTSFFACQVYLSTLATSARMHSRAQHDRIVASMGGEADDDPPKHRIVYALRDAEKAEKAAAAARNASATHANQDNTNDEADDSLITDAVKKQAGNQFGRAAHTKPRAATRSTTGGKPT